MNEQFQNELEEQARLLGMSAERECDLRGKIESERALADRLAKAVQNHFDVDGDIWATQAQLDNTLNRLESALTAWKEARND